MFYIKIVGALVVGSLLLFRKVGINRALQTVLYTYGMAWLFVALLYGCAYVVRILLKIVGWLVLLTDTVSNYKWYIQGGLFILILLSVLADTTTGRTANKSRVTTTSSKKSKVVIPIPIPNKRTSVKITNPANKNMTNINNKITQGQSVSLDFRFYDQSGISNSIKIANKSGAKITLTNIKGIQASTLSAHTQLARGKVILDCIYDDAFDAERLAEAGACFTFDCERRSSGIKDIAKKARSGHGHVVFINASWMNSFDMQELKKCGGENIEIR